MSVFLNLNPAEIVIGLIFVASILAALAQRAAVPYPTVLVLGGLLLSVVPGLPTVRLPPDVAFLVFVPPLVYLPAAQVALLDFRSSWRPIVMLSIGLVLFTMGALAALIRACIPGFDWSTALVLAAIVAPTDTIAVSAIARRVPIPHAVSTILTGESLFNDVVALVAYKMAIAAVMTGLFSISTTMLELLWNAGGGIAVGLLVGQVAVWARRQVQDPAISSALSLVTAFAAYLGGEMVHASGVLATVTAGLYVGRSLSTILEPEVRQGTSSFWSGLNFMLEGLAFVLIGLELRPIMASLDQVPLVTLARYAALISGAAILLRFVWVALSTALRLLFHHEALAVRSLWKHAAVVGWAGMRGVDSLAAALSIPLVLPDGITAFPQRGLILFLAFSVILATLVLQGSTLSRLIRLLGLAADGVVEREEAMARLAATEAALRELREVEAHHAATKEMIAHLRDLYEHRAAYLRARLHCGDDIAASEFLDTSNSLMRRMLRVEREAVLRLRDEGAIGSTALHRVERSLDFDELRLLPE
jgi:CPA1 family monovalent cation:H+ antiporter